MHNIRIIPRIDIKGPNLVKGIHLEGLRVLGRPEAFAKYYYENEADELIYMDVVASLYGRNSLHDIISKTASEIFIPLTVGGGLRTLEDISNVLRCGADKVAINTAAVKNPKIIKDAANKFGSSTIVIAIEAIKQADGRYLAYTDNGRDYTGIEVLSWAKQVEELGAGEILLTSVDNEGTGQGFDLQLLKMVSDYVYIPVIAHGGAGSLKHIHDAITFGHADAISLSSMIHYKYIQYQKDSTDSRTEGNVEFLKSGKTFLNLYKTDIQEIKNYMISKNIDCRYVNCT